MTKPLGSFDSQGAPNLAALAFIGNNTTPDQIMNLLTIITLNLNKDSYVGAAGVAFTVPFNCTVLDVIVQAEVTSSSGTVTLSNNAVAVTNAIAMGTNKTIVRAGTIDQASAAFVKDDSFKIVTNAAADRGIVRLLVLKN